MGRKLDSLTNANIGAIIRFRYDGGSRAGAVREVAVERKFLEGIVGRDLTTPPQSGEHPYRQYKNVLASDIEVVKEQWETYHDLMHPKDEETPNEEPVAKAIHGVDTIVTRADFVVVREQVKNGLERLSSEELAALYQKLFLKDKAAFAKFDTETGEVVVKETVMVPYFIVSSNVEFTIVNTNGDNLFVKSTADETGVCVAGKSVTPEELARAIFAHIGK